MDALSDSELKRRLIYVAMARARQHLYFVVNDNNLGEATNPTPYLAEMGLTIPHASKGARG